MIFLLDPKVVENLKKYENYEKCTCLECGYEGMMGVGEPTVKAYVRIPINIVLTVSAMLIFLFSAKSIINIVLILAVVVPILIKLNKHYLYCPNCGKKLKKR